MECAQDVVGRLAENLWVTEGSLELEEENVEDDRDDDQYQSNEFGDTHVASSRNRDDHMALLVSLFNVPMRFGSLL